MIIETIMDFFQRLFGITPHEAIYEAPPKPPPQEKILVM